MIDTEAFVFHTLARPIVQGACKIGLHPNWITLSSIVSTVYLYVFHKANKPWWVVGMMFWKWMADGLDGEVARQCDRKSRLGGFLDTYADMFFILVLLKILLRFWVREDAAWIMAVIGTFATMLFIAMAYSADAHHEHSLMKGDERPLAWVINNVGICIALVAWVYLRLAVKA